MLQNLGRLESAEKYPEFIVVYPAAVWAALNCVLVTGSNEQ
jgi:hypothetical protein